MRFCTHCGAQVPDNSKFCTACGTPIDAPDEATVTISDPEEEVVEASDAEGEFTAASWSPSPAAKPQPAAQPNPAPAQRPQPQPQPQAVPLTQSAGPKKGFFHYLWLYIKIILLVVAIVFVALFIKGLFTEEPDKPQPDVDYGYEMPTASRAVEGDGFENIADMSESDREEYLNYMNSYRSQASAQSKAATVQVGPVKFLLSGDYKIASREHMQNAEACIIVPKKASNKDNRLKVVIIPGAPQEATGFTSEEIGYILSSNLGELVEELTDGKYDVHYEDNADGKYFPHCYTFLNLNKGGKLVYTYTESTFVNGDVLTGCAVATDQAELAALMDIYSAVVVGDFL